MLFIHPSVLEIKSNPHMMTFTDFIKQHRLPYQLKEIPFFYAELQTSTSANLLKWFTMSQLVLEWSRIGFYKFKELIMNIQNEYPQKKCYLLLENYYTTLYDYEQECIWTPSQDFQYSKKTKHNLSLYMPYAKFARLFIHPLKLQENLQELRDIGCKIEYFFDASAVYTWINNCI